MPRMLVEPLEWTGRGLSYAVAEAAAAEARLAGLNAYAVSVPELGRRRARGTVIAVSRTGNVSDIAPDVVIGEDLEDVGATCLRIDSPSDRGHWLALPATEALLHASLDLIGADAVVSQSPSATAAATWLYEAYASVARTAMTAAAYKAAALGVAALDVDEIGHGFHTSLLHGAPAVVVRSDDAGSRREWGRFTDWCASRGITLEEQSMHGPCRPAAVLTHAIRVIEVRAAALRVDLSRRPIHDSDDGLRDSHEGSGRPMAI
ncbi:MAG: hypothetical protein QOJ29_4552 [Thermoleophilaceae bacterium]|nr:hypothetical protein [Thermoleophilaceae bacterium]